MSRRHRPRLAGGVPSNRKDQTPRRRELLIRQADQQPEHSDQSGFHIRPSAPHRENRFAKTAHRIAHGAVPGQGQSAADHHLPASLGILGGAGQRAQPSRQIGDRDSQMLTNSSPPISAACAASAKTVMDRNVSSAGGASSLVDRITFPIRAFSGSGQARPRMTAPSITQEFP